jgi:hypothetical protein
MRLNVYVGVVTAFAGWSFGQWSTNPAAQLLVGDAAGDQNQPKIRLAPDGGCFVSYLSTQGTGWDTFVQKLDPDGVELYAHNGLNVADTNFSSTEDYGLAVDADGNALVAFRDDRSGITQITLVKIAPDGSLPWTAAGVTVSAATTNGEVHSPGVVVTSDGSYVVGYSRGTTTTNGRAWYQKVTAAGALVWGTGGVMIAPTSNSYNAGAMVAGDNGSVLAVLQTSGSFTSNRRVHAQKLDGSTGAQVWNAGTPLVVQTANQLQVGNFASAVSDGSDGIVIAWYEVPNGAFMCRAQRIDSGGTQLFPAGGSPVATTPGRLRTSPDVAFDAATSSTYVFYSESDTTQTNWSVYGQKFDSTGASAWGAGGLELFPLASAQTSFVRTTPTSGGVMVAWFLGTNGAGTTQTLHAVRVLADSTIAGSPVVVDSNAAAAKTRLSAAAASDGAMLLAYGEGSGGTLDIRAARVNPDLTLGAPSCVADVDDGSGTGTPDGGVTIDDLIYYLTLFEAGDVGADVDDGTGTGTPDGGVTIDDLIYYLTRFEAGC